MIRRILKGAATVASLPVWIVGNALMVPLLKRQLRRETQRADNLAHERNHLDGQAEAMRRERDEVQRKLNLANSTVCEQIEALSMADARVNTARMALAVVGRERDRARKWSSLWHAKAGEYRFLWRNACGQAHDDMRRRQAAEGQLEPLRSAARDLVDVIDAAGPLAGDMGYGAKWKKAAIEAVSRARAALDGTPPVQDAPPLSQWVKPGEPCPSCGAQKVAGIQPHFVGCEVWRRELDEAARRPPACCMERCTESGIECQWKDEARPPVPGDYPEGDPVTQQWAGVCEDLQRKRDEDTRRLEAARRERDALRREVDTLKRELADADRVHDGVLNERLARHHAVLKEREEDLAHALCQRGTYSWKDLLGIARRAAQEAGWRP